VPKAGREDGGPAAAARDGPGRPAVWGAPRLLGLGVVLAAGLALRLWHIGTGLPDFIEEAIPFRRALAMWGWESGKADWNPHFFHYPSLSLYLHHLLQHAHVAWGQAIGRFANANDYYLLYRMDPSPMVVLARLLGVAGDAATLVGVAVIGERARRGAGLVAAALVAFAPVMVLTSRAIQADPLMTAFAVWGLERLLAYRDRGGAVRLAAAVALVGLAAGTKYTAGSLLAPLAWVLIERHRARAVPIGLAAVAAVVAVVLLTSPFILFEFGTFVRDLAFVRELPGAGHLGNLEARAFLFHLGHLARDLGWAAVVLLGLSLVRLALRVPGRGEAVVLWLALLGFAVPISLARIEAERYLVPVIPIAAVLIGVVAMASTGPVAEGWRRRARPALLAVLLLPALVAGVRAGSSGVDSTQIQARRWCQDRVAADELLVQEAYGVSLSEREASERAGEERPVRLASPRVRERFLARRAFRVVTLPLSVAGRCVSRVPVPGGPPRDVEIFPHAADFNRVFYDPRLLIGADYVLTSRAVRGRFEADSARFAAAAGYYRLLDEAAEVAARFLPGSGVVGPAIIVYRLGARTDSLIVARYGRLDPFWWAASIPEAYRRNAEGLLRPAGAAPEIRFEDPDGRPARWVASLAGVFEEKIHGFGSRMAEELTSLGRWDPAMRFAAANLVMTPADLEDCLAFTACAGRLGLWREARVALERAIAATAPDTPPIAYLRLERGRVLLHLDEPGRAREELEWVLAAANPDGELAAAARLGLEALGRPRARRDRGPGAAGGGGARE
jgi:hypothetical protein